MTTPPAASRTRRPRVLVTRAEEVPGERWDDYADCLEAAGADWEALDLADWQPDTRIEDYDGLVISGGVDIDPACYGEAPSSYVSDTNAARDQFETALLQDALERDLPVLGVCRGHQLLNVAHGGSLLQHIAEREPHRARSGEDGAIDSGWHEVALAQGSLLAGLFDVPSLRVNSRHHQAVTLDRLAPGLRVAATTPDGVVEALERPDRRWVVSVQWHPERKEDGASQRPIFEAFVEACAATAQQDG
ncbi:MAG: gamma-glutamyl-gamma-aminobutyrate hydrolase family protein [Chloroflexi bacterium]|nr:gamma-glutamyl-gamma-aminobutyrate hydrolase family protein [Chloroflexota bacterium]